MPASLSGRDVADLGRTRRPDRPLRCHPSRRIGVVRLAGLWLEGTRPRTGRPHSTRASPRRRSTRPWRCSVHTAGDRAACQGGSRLKQIVIDCHHPAGLAKFWAAALDDFDVRAYDDAEIARLAALGVDARDRLCSAPRRPAHRDLLPEGGPATAHEEAPAPRPASRRPSEGGPAARTAWCVRRGTVRNAHLDATPRRQRLLRRRHVAPSR